ncbi:hypothetical protein [Parabacteroides sp. Marseille-P3160]|uniref:hypothetical protein n=1 Tax=Parabacteroides sp. Marseille-P3160 TaxID=1917887 RepID=UPI0009B96ADB|nr:hypothetical protein [Parabacteroides sp. Marseille-P3160]
MSNRIIDITTFAGRDLKSRITVSHLYNFISNHDKRYVKIDFGNVDFATRSFIDEFYNVFINNPDIKTELLNVSPEIEAMFKAVKSTQRKPKATTKKNDADSVIEFSSISEASDYLSSLTFH